MAKKRQVEKVDLDRRAMILWALAGASALVLSKGGSVLAQEKGVETKVIKEAESMVPGFAKVRLREVTYQPGAGSKRTMKNPMICECSLGSLEVTQDDKTFTAKRGAIWTCKTGLVEGNVNKGTTKAIMRVFDLLPA